jgi:hypothetical protein
MKPFNKSEAISGNPVVTRDGRKVTQLKEFRNGSMVFVGVMEGSKGTTSWTDYGTYWGDKTIESEMDLFMCAVVKEGWVAFGTQEAQTGVGAVGFCTHAWPSKAESTRSYRIANNGEEPKGTVKVTWEE